MCCVLYDASAVVLVVMEGVIVLVVALLDGIMMFDASVNVSTFDVMLAVFVIALVVASVTSDMVAVASFMCCNGVVLMDALTTLGWVSCTLWRYCCFRFLSYSVPRY